MLLLALPGDDDATFGLIVDNLFNIDDAIFAVGFTVVVVLVGIFVLIVAPSTLLVLLTDFGIGIGIIAFDVTFSL